MTILEKIKSRITYCDGGAGTLLQSWGLKAGEQPESWNITKPDKIIEMHRQYLEAGADIITSCTFGANRLKFDNLEEIVTAAIKNAKTACEGYDAYVALDIGPTGKMLEPLGDLKFEDAVSIFSETIKIGANAGADLVLIETINDSYEAKAAMIAAKESCNLPVFVTCVYDESKKLMTGADPAAMIAMLEGLGADAIGMNCSLGPKQMAQIVPEFAKYASVPIIVNPNAGLPRSENGKTVFDINADEFSDIMCEIVKSGATIIGGCCGTTPEHIRKTVEKTKNLPFTLPEKKSHTVVSSYTHAVEIGKCPVIIGERINPTGKKRFKEALRENDIGYILNEGLAQNKKGVSILDVNVGLPEINETEMMVNVIKALQGIINLPLQIDTVDPAAMEQAMRIYNGKPLVNSVSGKEESMDAVFPLIKKYGGVVIAVTLDESGIPTTAQGRVEIAKKIITKAKEYGIDEKDIIVDPLAMAVSSDSNSANITLEAIKTLHNMGIKTSLGVSNISFGLPSRADVNAVFYTMAMQNGLDCAIINPFSDEMMKAWHCFMALTGKDKNCSDYIEFADKLSPVQIQAVQKSETSLDSCIVSGLKEQAGAVAAELLKTSSPMEIIDGMIIPALNTVGMGFEEKKVYLPQLLMSAQAAKEAFEAIKSAIPAGESKKGKVVIATVKGDIHDIGKNIVKVLLENYGYEVIDLGKDIAPEVVVDAVKSSGAKLVGLSALMTTTVPAMEETIKLLKKNAPDCKVMVGGAVMTEEYAAMINADSYGSDAMASVRYAEKIYNIV
ncbi:MAG: homocysteine S-methyltransferase family protein [Clostridia bacterium]|nr:homocysteine S-methyltransferase family protein [Clostridia bacterium]